MKLPDSPGRDTKAVLPGHFVSTEKFYELKNSCFIFCDFVV